MTQYRKFEGPAIVVKVEERRGLDNENSVQKKIKDHEVGRLFFDVYQHLAKPDDEADRPRSMR